MNDEETQLFEAACQCLLTGIPYGKTWLDMTRLEHHAFLKAYQHINRKA